MRTLDDAESAGASGAKTIAGTTNVGGSLSSGGTTAAAGATAAAGMAAAAGVLAGTTGTGDTVVNTCDGAQLLLVIPRSMLAGGGKHENPLAVTLIGTVGYSGALLGYWEKLDVGALFFVGLQTDDQVECPIVSSVTPESNTNMQVSRLISNNYDAYEANPQAKMSDPVPEAIAAAAGLLKGDNRHLLLIATGAPDSCQETGGQCAVDPSIKAIQDAKEQGITTHVIGVGTNDRLNTAGDDQGFETYLSQLANAGVGTPVKKSAVFDTQCKDRPATATYSAENGDAHVYHAADGGHTDAAIIEILKSICP